MDPAAGRAIFCRDKPGRLMVPVLPLFLLLFVLVPLLELVLLIEVGGRIGALATVGLCLLTALLGGLLVRSQGRRVLDAIRTALAAAVCRCRKCSTVPAFWWQARSC